MEELLKKLKNYSRFLELEDSIPYWERQIPELKDRIGEMKWNQRQKELELLQLQEPNFFQRVFGRAEEKKEKRTRQIREITAALTAANWELEALEKKIASGKQELEAIAGSRAAYLAAREETALSPAQESRLMMEEISAFAPLAMETAGRILEALEDARPWMRQDVRYTGVKEGNRKMECLNRAAENAKRLVVLLESMPQGVADVGSYLRSPEHYVDAVTMEYAKLDRLNNAQEQIRNVRNQLRLLLGE